MPSWVFQLYEAFRDSLQCLACSIILRCLLKGLADNDGILHRMLAFANRELSLAFSYPFVEIRDP